MTGPGRAWLALAVVTYLALAAGWLLWVPAYESADESTHLEYALHVGRGDGLPVVRGNAARLGLPFWTEETQAYQPPLYYELIGLVARALGAGDALVALRVNPMRGRQELSASYHLNYLHGPDEVPPFGPGMRVLLELRLVSVVLGLFIVVATFVIGRRVFPDDTAVAGLGALIVASLPRFVHGAAAVHNELLSAAFATVALLLLFAWTNGARPRPGRAIVLGTIIGLGLLTKLDCLDLLPLTALVLLWPCLRERRMPRTGEWLAGALVLGCAAAVCAWWYVGNILTYGDPFALGAQREMFFTLAVSNGRIWSWLSGGFLPGFFGSWLGNFGWFAVPTHPAAAAAGVALLLAATAGWLLWWRRGRAPEGTIDREGARLLRWTVVLVLIEFFIYNLRITGPDARYTYGALAPIGLLVAAGLLVAWRAAGRLRSKALAALLVAAVPLGSGALLVFQARPALRAEDAPSDRYHASLVLNGATVPEHPAVEQLGPPDGTASVAPPMLRWSGDARTDPTVPWTIDFAFAPGRPMVSLYDEYDQVVKANFWRVPAKLWDLFPVGQPVLWRVRLLPDRSRGENELTVPSSGFRSVVRLPDG